MEEQLKVIKIVNKDKTYIDGRGKERVSVNYYLKFQDTLIAIRPVFHKNYNQLDLLATRIVNGKRED